MKLILLAATAFVAAPVMAQTSGQTDTNAPMTATQTAPAGTADQTMTPPPADQSAMPAGQTAPAPASDMSAPAAQTDTQAPMTTGSSATPMGGYQPSAPALSGGTPGSNLPPVFRQAPTPDQAFPPPAPQAEYPICKKGQYDGCMQASQAPHKAMHKAKRHARR